MHSPRSSFWFVRLLPLVVLLIVLSGCNHLRSKPSVEYVYVVAKETYLRDRIAAVSNRVANVTNGERLEVVEHSRRFLKVKTPKGEIGWIEEHGVIDQSTYQQFLDLSKQHQKDPVIATATLRDDLYLHVKPGRKEDRFYLLPENDKLQMLVRASVPKDAPPQAVPLAKPATAKPGNSKADATKSKTGVKTDAAVKSDAVAPAPPLLEDWWLVRDSSGRVGWMLSRRLDIDVPDAIGRYAENQRMIGAYVLTTVSDPESDFPNGQVPEYVTVLVPYKDGLPYDFDQVRVFTWNVKKHRYETAYRQRDLQGYLPVHVGMQTFDKIGTVPIFSFKTAADDTISIDPATGSAKPANTTVQTYRLEGVIVRKVEPPGATPTPAPAPQEPAVPAKKEKKGHRHAAHPAAHARKHKHR